jgi:hypothetical protein
MWLDECFTYYGVAHDSYGDFLQSYKANFSTVPPMYLFAVWALSKVIPLSVLSLRIYSSIGCGLGLCFLWAVLRRHFGFFVSSIATLAVCLTSSLFLAHNAEARFYGLYFALIAWAVYNYDRLCDEEPSTAQLFVNGLSHALAVSCTYVAGFYSLAILISLIIRDRVVGVRRPRVYLSVVAGWLPLLFYAPIMWGQRSEAGLISPPLAGAILHPFDPGLDIYFVFCALAGLFVITSIGKPNKYASNSRSSGSIVLFSKEIHLLILSFGFLLVPYVLLFISWAGMPLLLDRYVLPSLIGMALLFAPMFACLCGESFGASQECTTRLERIARLLGKTLRVLLLGGLLLYPLKHAISWVHSAAASQRADPVPDLRKSKTVFATSDAHSYFSLYFYSGEAKNIYMIVRGPKEYEKFKQFNQQLNPITVDDFLKSNKQFIAVSASDRSRWFEDELRSNGTYNIKIESEWRAESGNKKLLTVRQADGL